jgi:serine/threonine-protein kinase ATR
VLTWRNENVPEKEVWLTEFGWDASTKPAPATGDFAKWEGSTELQQAEWIVRGFMVLSATAVDRAYLFFFNDEDEPHVHGSSGLTRNFQPKPSYYALSHLQAVLGGYRFVRAIRDDPADCFVYEYQSGDAPDRRIWAVWRPQGPEKETTLAVAASGIEKAERMPLAAGAAEPVRWTEEPPGSVRLEAGEAPVYLWLKPM